MHEKFHDLLQQYIDEELEPLETIILEEHLATCKPCRKVLNQLKLLDWNLEHQPTVEPPPELETYRIAAVKAHLAGIKTAGQSAPLKEAWRFQQHILRHTFSFISYNPVNHSVTRSVKKPFYALARTAGNHFKKRNPLLSRFIPGQA